MARGATLRFLPVVLLAILTACAPKPPSSAVTTMNPDGIAGTYRNGNLVLDLRPDSSATFTDPSGAHAGRWSGLPPQLRFDFELGAGPRPESITWTIRGDDLIPLIWDKSVYGPPGPVLRRAR